MRFLILFALFVSICVGAEYEPKTIVYNIGQGNCVLTLDRDLSILSDCGYSAALPPNAVQQIASKIISNVNKLLVTLSHADEDHINLLLPILNAIDLVCRTHNETFSVFFIEDFLGDAEGYPEELQKLINAAKNNIKLNSIQFSFVKNQKVLITENLTIQRISNKSLEGAANDKSIIIKITDKKFKNSILLTGDATNYTFNNSNQNELASNILLASHHGAFENNMDFWLNKIKPNYIIVSSSGYRYRHPSWKTMEIFVKYFNQNSFRLVRPHILSWLKKMHNIQKLAFSDFYPILKYSTEDTLEVLGDDIIYSSTAMPLYTTHDNGDIIVNWAQSSIDPAKQFYDSQADSLIELIERADQQSAQHNAKIEFNIFAVAAICGGERQTPKNHVRFNQLCMQILSP